MVPAALLFLTLCNAPLHPLFLPIRHSQHFVLTIAACCCHLLYIILPAKGECSLQNSRRLPTCRKILNKIYVFHLLLCSLLQLFLSCWKTEFLYVLLSFPKCYIFHLKPASHSFGQWWITAPYVFRRRQLTQPPFLRPTTFFSQYMKCLLFYQDIFLNRTKWRGWWTDWEPPCAEGLGDIDKWKTGHD